MRLAERLAGAETLVGIKSDQIDAWRDYTSALIDLFTPPTPPAHPTAGPGGAGADNAFARQEQIAQRMKARAAKADALLQAITALRAKLTPQQIDRLSTIELFPRPPMRGPGPEGRGPMDGGMGRGPMGPGAWTFGPGPHRPGAGEPADHGPMMGPAGDVGPDQAGPDAMDDGPGPMNEEAPMPAEPDAAGPGPDAPPPAPQQ
ncbi:hypothetical protein SAMN02745157_1122 [Kaistia soli DSM 19436]|uniref:LTXXQ motif family protein n=1 Tax=Kaistia soli DSM 19436 TaxID=1122133 RepID=A0A1M4X1L3_9HYPH|nr:hypothetical protein [Kaistia soli]SHE87335.1 hypothetical protein SAMN02745157_1122 [Kaistia soli DSM 19436]